MAESTLEKVGFHLAETTDDGGTDKLRELMRESGSGAEPTVQKIIAALLKFQGQKFSYADPTATTQCTDRLHALVEGCLHRLGTQKWLPPSKAFDEGEL